MPPRVPSLLGAAALIVVLLSVEASLAEPATIQPTLTGDPANDAARAGIAWVPAILSGGAGLALLTLLGVAAFGARRVARRQALE